MTVDVKVYEFSKLWLSAGGWTSELDVDRLACLIQDICEDFTTDLENQYEQEAHHGGFRKGS